VVPVPKEETVAAAHFSTNVPIGASTLAKTVSLATGATQTAEEDPSPGSKHPIEKESTDNHLSILVAEDDPINSLIINKRMRKQGHSVKLTVNGQQCADAFKVDRDKYDLILMDMQVSDAFYLPSIMRV